MRTMPLDDTMMRLKQDAQEREEKLGSRTSRDNSNPANDEDDTGAAVHEHSDTWGFSWMPAIEDFVEQAALRAADDEDYDSDGETENGREERYESAEGEGNTGEGGGHLQRSVFGMQDAEVEGGGDSAGTGGRKRTRLRMNGGKPSASRRQRAPPQPPSYNETLLADKSFHNPYASETMADAFGIIRPASFIVDVRADDRTWGGAAEAATAAQATTGGRKAPGVPAEEASAREGSEKAKGDEGLGEDRRWFYDTVRDRQNRLWADTRVRKGVELARKGQHQAAIDMYTQALGMCPDHDDGLVARGAAFATTGRLRQAMQDLSRALSLNPRNENASTYLTETRRRLERQETRVPPTPGTAAGGARGLAADSGNRRDASSDGAVGGGASMLRAHEGDDTGASQAALKSLLQDSAEGDALRKMRVLLEEDERKRKRERKSEAGEGLHGDGDGDESSHRSKKSRKKKDKKSKSSRYRSSTGRHKRDREKGKERDSRKGTTDGAVRYDDGGSTSDSSGSGSDESDVARSKKKKKRRRHKSKKRSSRARSASPSHSSTAGSRIGGGGLGGPMTMSLAAGAGEDSGEEAAHPILQRKKHSLWG